MDWRSGCAFMSWQFTQCYQQQTGNCLTERKCCICTMIDCMFDHTTCIEWAKTIDFQLLRDTDKNFLNTLAHKLLKNIQNSRSRALPVTFSTMLSFIVFTGSMCILFFCHLSLSRCLRAWYKLGEMGCGGTSKMHLLPQTYTSLPDKYKHFGRTDEVVIIRIQIGHMKSNNSKNVTKDKHKYQWNY